MDKHSYAQTPPQFYVQLIEHVERGGHLRSDEIDLLIKACDIGSRLFAGRVRDNGKAFSCHAIGTGSVLLANNRPSDEIAAGIIHAAYEQGRFYRFGFMAQKPGVSDAKRRFIRQSLGDSVEELLFQYDAFKWHRRSILAFGDKAQKDHAMNQAVFIMRLANEIDEFLDGGICFSNKPSHFEDEEVNAHLADLADRYQCKELFDEVIERIAVARKINIPEQLRSKHNRSYDLSRIDLSKPES